MAYELPAQLSLEQVGKALESLGIPAGDDLERVEIDLKGVRVTYLRQTVDEKRFVYGHDAARETHDIGWLRKKEGE